MSGCRNGDLWGRWSRIVSAIRIVHSSADEQALLGELVGGKMACVLGFVNAHAMNLIADSTSFFDALGSADILLRDGSGMAILYRWWGRAPGLNMNGTDFIQKILAAYYGRRVAFWGTEEPYLGRAAVFCELEFGVEIVSRENGFHDDNFYIHHAVKVKPDLIVLGMSMPKQERVAYVMRSAANMHSLIVCGGAIIDILGGKVPRAPKWMRTLGVEWLYRLFREPKRLFKRYVIGNPLFLCRVLASRVHVSER